MQKHNFLITYDIANIKRLRKIAKVLEKEAIRIQFSIFYLPNVTISQMQVVLDEILSIYNKNEDDIRVYSIKNSGIKLGKAVDLDKPFNFF